MDEATLRPVVDAHAQAAWDRMDVAHVQADLIDELHPQLPAIAQMLPQPVRSATVDSIVVADDHATALITYTGDDSSVTLNSRWEDRGGKRPQVVSAAPTAAVAGTGPSRCRREPWDASPSGQPLPRRLPEGPHTARERADAGWRQRPLEVRVGIVYDLRDG